MIRMICLFAAIAVAAPAAAQTALSIDALAADNPGSPLFEWEQRRDMRRWKAFDLEIATDSEACPSLRLRVRNK